MDNKINIDYDDNNLEIKVLIDVHGTEWDWSYLDDYGIFQLNFTKKNNMD